MRMSVSKRSEALNGGDEEREKGDGCDILTKNEGQFSLRPRTSDNHEAYHSPRQNLILDYKNLRKTGYFLATPEKCDQPRVEVEKGSKVEEWLRKVGEEGSLDFSSDSLNIDGLQGSELHYRYESSAEERLKRLVLSGKARFTSEPKKTLGYQELSGILDCANEKIDKLLEENRKSGLNENEYVCGTVAFPESWRSRPRSDWREESGKGFVDWLKQLFYPHSLSKQDSISQVSIQQGQLILEPYHGPIFLNGAVIKAGLADQGKVGAFKCRLVEEVKAVLRAIHRALYKQEEEPLAEVEAEKDPEIVKWTELVKQNMKKKKRVKKSLFVLNPKIPPRGRPQRRVSYTRVVNGMIQRNIAQGSRPIRYRLVREQEGYRLREEGRGFAAGLMSLAGMFVPFQMPQRTAAIPANQVLLNFQRQQHFLERIDDRARIIQVQNGRKRKQRKNVLRRIGV